MTTCLPNDVRDEVKRLSPPDERDREIFQRVRGGRESQAAVAKDYGISQPRVSQIVERVQNWLVEATPEETGDLPAEKRLRLGGRLVRMRLECLLDATMQSWRASQGDLTTIKSSDQRTERVTRRSFGDVKYLTAYRYVALALARLDGVPTAPKVERRPVTAAPAAVRSASDSHPATAAESVEAPQAAASDLYVEPAAEAAGEPVAAKAMVETSVAATTSAMPAQHNPTPAPRQSPPKSAYERAWEHRERKRQKAARRREMLAAK